MAEGRERDLVLAPNEYAFILDETKGHVIAYVGPHKTSLANTDRPVLFEAQKRRFVRCNLEEAITPYPFAEEGWYIVLENPAREGDEEHPKSGSSTLPRLTLGRKVNIPGPSTFPLWPGQVAEVIHGHHLRSNQYLVVRVYNEEAARENWAKAVMKPQGPEAPPAEVEAPDLTMGKLLAIQGTGVSFYIPPTGIEVVRDAAGHYVREAVTLERLEYCILLDEDGNKRFIRGPAVVFPKPTEAFIEKNGTRKFKAIELNELSGIYVKVIAPYQEGGVDYKVGEELFITGTQQMIYFPRPEHAIIKYGDRDIHHAVAIPAGEARYVLDRLSGEIRLQRGPAMFLPDPRKAVIVRRVLDEKTVSLLFPGNPEALEINRRLMGIRAAQPAGAPMAKKRDLLKAADVAEEGPAEWGGDDFTRGYSPPRTITLIDKYEGAVNINVWTGYAVLVVGKGGQRHVIVGPNTYMLQYDETLEAMELSTGVPKTDENVLRTVYLRVLNNKISDRVTAETRDLVQVHLGVSYRVNFIGEPERWFNVENYVKFLTDHMRSLLHNAIKQHGLEAFYGNAINIVRDVVLGTGTEGKRSGRTFEENGMQVYDVEVLEVSIGDSRISDVLTNAQHSAVQQAVKLAEEERKLDVTQRTENIKRKIAEAESSTALRLIDLKNEEITRQLALVLAQIDSEAQSEDRRLQFRQARQAVVDVIEAAQLARQKAKEEMMLGLDEARQKQRLAELEAEVQAVVNKAGAISPDLVAALQAFSDRALAERMAQSMAPLAILGGKSVSDVLGQLLRGTPLESVLKPVATNGGQ
ncbi:MAG TPA: hypothetical protein VGO93_14070 [Candidatus Xenobia bacterium]